jgi:hypothetical protein
MVHLTRLTEYETRAKIITGTWRRHYRNKANQQLLRYWGGCRHVSLYIALHEIFFVTSNTQGFRDSPKDGFAPSLYATFAILNIFQKNTKLQKVKLFRKFHPKSNRNPTIVSPINLLFLIS